MSRTAINFLVDCILLVLILCVLWTTALVQFVFAGASQGSRLLGHDLEWWRTFQTGCVGALAIGVLLHLVLHWAWVCGFVAARVGRWTGRRVTTNEATRTVYGVALLATLLTVMGAALFLAQASLKRPVNSSGQHETDLRPINRK